MVQKSRVRAKDIKNMPIKDTGRPSKFTKERREAILQDISDGIPYSLAAEANGICEETLYDWLRTGKENEKAGIESDYAIFSQSIKKQEMERIKEHLSKLRGNVERWQADAWTLERRWYKLFGNNVHLNEMQERLDKLEAAEAKDKDEVDAGKLHRTESEEA